MARSLSLARFCRETSLLPEMGKGIEKGKLFMLLLLCCSLFHSVSTRGLGPIAVAQTPSKPEYPNGIAVGGQGVIYVIDQEAPRIYRVSSGDKLTVVYQGSKMSGTPVYRPKALVQDNAGNLFVCDPGTMDVWRMSSDGTKLFPLTGERFDSKDSGAKGKAFDPQGRYSGKLSQPLGITMDSEGNLIVADAGLDAILRIPARGGDPVEMARIPVPCDIARDGNESFVVVSRGADQLVRVNSRGNVSPIVKGLLAPKDVVSYPHHVIVDQRGYIVSDGYARALWRVSRDGKVTPLFQGDPLKNPVGIALEPSGNILVIDTSAKALFRVSPDGKVNRVLSFE